MPDDRSHYPRLEFHNLWLIFLCAANVVLILAFFRRSDALAILAYVAFFALFLVNGLVGGRRAKLGWTILSATLGFGAHLVSIAAIPFGPYNEHGVGYAPCSILFVAPLTAIGYFVGRYVRQMPEPGLCPKCRYDLRGNLSGTCPECGYRFG